MGDICILRVEDFYMRIPVKAATESGACCPLRSEATLVESL
jgi:hypothetical protein